jgi:hypothetical protein
VTGVVIAAIRAGLFVRLTTPEVEAFVDQGLVHDEPPQVENRSWPRIGAAVTAIVHRYTPDGQLRLTMRASDLAWAEGREPRPDFWRDRISAP